MSPRGWNVMCVSALAGIVWMGSLAAAGAQAPVVDVEVEPITCWWRSDVSAIRVGQPFGVTLTCSILDAAASRVILDESRLDPSVAQLPPFDVVSGARADDLVTPGRRFVQYRYDVRLIAEHAFGSEALVPPLQLTYRIESRAQQGDTVQGRDQAYAMTPIPVRVQSLVPNSATDIREAPVVSFDAIESTSLRARVLRTSSVILVVVGTLLALIALVRWIRAHRASRATRVRTASPRAVLAAVRRDLRNVARAVTTGGWSPDLVGRALSALRITGGYASGRVVAQRESSLQAAPLDGQLVVRGLTGASMLVSGSTTALRLGADTDVRLRDALSAFTAARFGREEATDASLDDALAQGIAASAQVAADHAWRKVTLRRMGAGIGTVVGRVWRR